MKIERAESKFEPVVITLESQEELDCLLICLNTNNVIFERNASSLLEDEIFGQREVSRAQKLFGAIYNQIQSLY